MASELDQAIAALHDLLPQDMSRYENADLGAWATYYATQLGWPVFPLAAGDKTPLTRRGFKDASNNPVAVKAWWQRNPTANIGAPTGVHFDAIDIDAPKGFDTWTKARAHWRGQGIAEPSVIAISHTGNAGRHLLIAPQGPNGAAWGDGLDYRGAGGYIVLPPSKLANGGYYSWLKAPA